MGYIIGLVVIAHIVGAIILLLYGLVTDPLKTLAVIAGFVIFIVLAFIAIVLFFQIKRFLFFCFTTGAMWMEIGRRTGIGVTAENDGRMVKRWRLILRKTKAFVCCSCTSV